jgi:hypothetical protein
MRVMTTPGGRARFLELAGIGALLVAAAVFVARSLGRDSDFQVFHAAATAAAGGLDPYDLADLSRAAGRTIELPFLYPSASLALFAPFARLPLALAERLWLVLQIGAAVALLVRWRRDFVPRTGLFLFVLVALFGFDAALLWDLRVRNVALIEAWLLWTAFAGFVADRPARFAVLVALAASFKLLPIVFLGLLLVPAPPSAASHRAVSHRSPIPPRQTHVKVAIAGLASFAALIGLPVAFGPAWAREFATRFASERPYGEINPSSLGLIDQVLAPWSATGAGSIMAVALWAAWSIALIVASRGFLVRIARDGDRRELVMLAALLFTLLTPRMMVYSYVLMVAPALWLIPRLDLPRALQVALWIAILLQGALQLLPGRVDWGFFGYAPLAATLALWIAWMRADSRRTSARAAPSAIERVSRTATASTGALLRRRATPRVALARAALAVAIMSAVAMTTSGCGGRAESPGTRFAWVIGRVPPRFDPDGPPDPARWALERLLTRGLVREDSTGAVVVAAARRVEVSDDSLVYTFRLPAELAFMDGSPCHSAHFRAALEAGLARSDHGTKAWLLSAVRGVDRVRAGKPLPPLGIETPDETTLVIRLARPDPSLLACLALPGASDAWRSRDAPGFAEAAGLGPYRVARADSTRRLVLVRTVAGSSGEAPDTIDVRFLAGASRVRSYLRQNSVDLAWPLPPALLDEALPSGYRMTTRTPRPARRLLLVMRADLPPTSRPPARHALAHGLNRPALLRDLGERARATSAWIPGAGPFDFPRLDAAEVRLRMEEGRFRRSFHVDLAYDADGTGAAIARGLQGEWARLSIYVELVPLRGEAWRIEQSKGLRHLLLVESQALLDDPATELATLVMPLRGPAVGGIRTAWRTRELDPWLLRAEPWPPGTAADVQHRLEQDRIILPLADLPWIWVAREGAADPGFHPRFGPSPRLPL